MTFQQVADAVGYKQRGTANSDMRRTWRLGLAQALKFGRVLGIPDKETKKFWKAERLKKFKEKLEQT